MRDLLCGMKINYGYNKIKLLTRIKVKLALEQAMKAQTEIRRVALLFLSLTSALYPRQRDPA